MYLDKRLKKTVVPNKGFGIVAVQNINKGDILIKDIPFTFKSNVIYSDVFQLLYEVLQDGDAASKFMKLQPKSLKNYTIYKDKIMNELNRLKKYDIQMHNFFTINYTINELILLCAKYMSNAFEFKSKPSLLFIGTLLNHSCLPNVIFGEHDGYIVFIAVRNINKGEEICDNYVDITLSRIDRKKHLLIQYGFECKCERCDRGTESNQLDKKSIEIEKKRLQTFGYSKSKKLQVTN